MTWCGRWTEQPGGSATSRRLVRCNLTAAHPGECDPRVTEGSETADADPARQRELERLEMVDDVENTTCSVYLYNRGKGDTHRTRVYITLKSDDTRAPNAPRTVDEALDLLDALTKALSRVDGNQVERQLWAEVARDAIEKGDVRSAMITLLNEAPKTLGARELDQFIEWLKRWTLGHGASPI